MPSNKEYISQAGELAEKLGLEIKTEGLNNNELAKLVADLKAKKHDGGNETQADTAEAEAEAEAEDEVEDEKPHYEVGAGKSITTKRGILADGDEITASDLAGGKDALKAFVKSKHIIEN